MISKTTQFDISLSRREEKIKNGTKCLSGLAGIIFGFSKGNSQKLNY